MIPSFLPFPQPQIPSAAQGAGPVPAGDPAAISFAEMMINRLAEVPAPKLQKVLADGELRSPPWPPGDGAGPPVADKNGMQGLVEGGETSGQKEVDATGTPKAEPRVFPAYRFPIQPGEHSGPASPASGAMGGVISALKAVLASLPGMRIVGDTGISGITVKTDDGAAISRGTPDVAHVERSGRTDSADGADPVAPVGGQAVGYIPPAEALVQPVDAASRASSPVSAPPVLSVPSLPSAVPGASEARHAQLSVAPGASEARHAQPGRPLVAMVAPGTPIASAVFRGEEVTGGIPLVAVAMNRRAGEGAESIPVPQVAEPSGSASPVMGRAGTAIPREAGIAPGIPAGNSGPSFPSAIPAVENIGGRDETGMPVIRANGEDQKPSFFVRDVATGRGLTAQTVDDTGDALRAAPAQRAVQSMASTQSPLPSGVPASGRNAGASEPVVPTAVRVSAGAGTQVVVSATSGRGGNATANFNAGLSSAVEKPLPGFAMAPNTPNTGGAPMYPAGDASGSGNAGVAPIRDPRAVAFPANGTGESVETGVARPSSRNVAMNRTGRQAGTDQVTGSSVRNMTARTVAAGAVRTARPEGQMRVIPLIPGGGADPIASGAGVTQLGVASVAGNTDPVRDPGAGLAYVRAAYGAGNSAVPAVPPIDVQSAVVTQSTASAVASQPATNQPVLVLAPALAPAVAPSAGPVAPAAMPGQPAVTPAVAPFAGSVAPPVIAGQPAVASTVAPSAGPVASAVMPGQPVVDPNATTQTGERQAPIAAVIPDAEASNREAGRRRADSAAIGPVPVSGRAAPTDQAPISETKDLPAALKAALARISAEPAPSAPGVVKELNVVVGAGELGKVAIRVEMGADGTIRLELSASSAQAAQILKDQLPALTAAFLNRPVHVEIAPVTVGMPVAFTGGNQGGRQPRWFDRRPPAVSGGRSGVPGLAGLAQARQNYLVNVLA